MSLTSLHSFINAAGSAWAANDSNLIEVCRAALTKLAGAKECEPWLAELLAEKPATRELHRHPAHGFMLLAHTENEGLYRSPHDHGRAWVIYAVQSGELEIGTYDRSLQSDGTETLKEVSRSVLRPGEARAYLPGEVHDTRCLSSTALLYRFTERDLRHEDLVEEKVTRFIDRGGQWIAPRP